MSAIICHYFHGTRALKETTHPKIDQPAFLLGLQGPSVFWYGLKQKENSEEALAFWNVISKQELPELHAFFASYPAENFVQASYCLGVLCYCSLEQNIAPFVAYGSREVARLQSPMTVEDAKNQIESALDMILLRYETGKLPTEFNLKTAVPVEEEIAAQIAALYCALYQKCTGEEIAPSLVARLYLSGGKCIAKLNDRTLLKRQFLKRREKKQGKVGGFSSLIRNISEDEDYDYANVCENEWEDGATTRTEPFFALYETAISQSAVEMMQRWNQSSC